MSTGTTKDPYEDVKRPICGEFVEIGQPTFAELIWAREVLTRATSGPDPDVGAALRMLAYGKSPVELPEMRQQGAFQAILPPNQNSQSAAKYSVNSGNGAQAYQQKVRGLGMAKASVDFHNLIANDSDLVPGELASQALLSPQADNCAMISGNNAPVITPSFCPESDCNVDAIFAIDNSGSMGSSISGVQTGAAEMANLIDSVSGGSYRFALNTFCCGNTGNPFETIIPLTTTNCGNITQFQNAVNGIGTGGGYEPWDLVIRDVQQNAATEWTFRSDSDARVLFIITDEAENYIDGPAVSNWATELGRCGVRIAFIWTSPLSPYLLARPNFGSFNNLGNLLDDITEKTDGIWIQAERGLNIAPLMTSFILNVCESAQTVPECPGGEDKIINGQFETSIAGWDSLTGDITWDSPTQSMKIDNGSVRQEITGLTPGDIVILSFNTWVDAASGVPGTGTRLLYQLQDESSNELVSGTIRENQSPPIVGQDNATRLDLQTTVPISGTIRVFFQTDFVQTDPTRPFFVDNVLLCVLKEDDCGPGTRNLITNPNFENGVEFWDDATNTPISPPQDLDVWDQLLNAIIVSLTGEPEVRTTISDLTPGRNYSLNFELTSFEPSVIGTLEFIYGLLDSSNNVIQQATILRSASNPPERLQIDFVAPSDGIARVFFKGGVTSGVAKVRNVLLCDPSGTCDDGFTRISFDDFETGRGAWAGGRYDAVEQYMILEGVSGGDNTLSQTFTGLQPGSTFQMSFNVLNGVNGSGLFKVELYSSLGADPIIDQCFTNGPGIKTCSTVVQDTGTVVVFITNQLDNGFEYAIDDLLVCQQDAPPCDGSITDLEVLIEWDGIPRKPTNLFNAIVRYTIRNPDDPFDVTTITQITTSEGVLGLASCDTWKQQGQGGTPQNNILGFGITPSLAATISAGDFASVAIRSNFIWAIPDTGGIQDTLSVSFPAPPPGLIESVEVFLLANHVTPSGADSAPVNPPPLLCNPDPASELTVSIRYKNSQKLQREFTQRINKNNIWQQNADFTVGNPWDTVSAFNNGIKGTSARWESFEFVLDDVDGKGLDQCTTPLFFTATGEGILTFSEFGLQNGRGVFTDSCLAEILVTNLTPGSSTNEVQSVILPTPSGGTWTLQFDFGGQAPVTTGIPWDATAAQVEGALTALPNIGTGNVSVTGSGTQVDPFLVEFTGTLGARDHNLLIGNGDNLTGSSTAFVQTVTNGTTDERQTISRNDDTVFADLLITFGGETTTPLAFNRSLNEAQSALEGLSSIGAGNVRVTGDVTDRDAAYFGPLRVDFIGSLSSQNVGLMSVEPSAQYTVVQDWMGGPAPAGGVDEKQLVTIQAFGGTFTLRVYDAGSTVPTIDVQTTTDGGTSNNDIYDVEFDGTLSGTNISPINYDGDIAAGVVAAGSTIQNGDNTGTNPVNEIQRITFSWTPGGAFNTGLVGLQSPTDTNFSDLIGDKHPIQRGIDSSSGIKSYLESAAAVTIGDINVTNTQLYGTLDEVQTFTISGNPISGTFTLTLEGETTTDIPYDATAEQVALALNALPNVSGGITVTSSGALPSDVTYTVTFGGADSGRDWAQLIADARNLVGNAVFADTGAIQFNAPGSDVKDAIVTAASWLSNADINVTKVADTPDDTHQWDIVWTGAYTRVDIPQMLADGTLLSGAPITISEVTPGSGNNERQRLQIIRSTGGSFRIVMTIDGVRESTSPIPWNTTAAGLEAQLLQLSFFDPGQISVIDEYPGEIPPEPINASFIVVFQRIFGDVPLMEPKFQETLLCNPVVLPPIDPGPYPYPLPDCDDLNDISCQSGPLLCKPGEGDDPIPEIDCCDNETITSAANYSKRLQIERDLFDPNRKINGQRMTLRDLALIKGLNIGEYTPYERNWTLGTLTETTWSKVVETKLSFVLIENDLDSRRGRQRVLSHLSKHREILPARFVWPEVEFTQP